MVESKQVLIEDWEILHVRDTDGPGQGQRGGEREKAELNGQEAAFGVGLSGGR